MKKTKFLSVLLVLAEMVWFCALFEIQLLGSIYGQYLGFKNQSWGISVKHSVSSAYQILCVAGKWLVT